MWRFLTLVRSSYWIVLLFGVATAQGSHIPDNPDLPSAHVAASVRDGMVVLAVVPSTAGKARDTDETYGDWADNLNDFATNADHRIKIIKVTPHKYSEIVADPQIKDGFATLFIRDLSHVLLYKGMILEPKVYQLGQTYMLQHLDLKSVAPYGLEEVSVRLR